MMTKIKKTDTEKGRALIFIDIENGNKMPAELKAD